MSKKELDPNRMYSVEDQTEILRLYKVVVATQNDMDSIYHLFKKYIRPNATQYQTNCNCSTSIGAYYQLLLDWYSVNTNPWI